MNGKTAYLGDEYSYSYAAANRLSDGPFIALSTMTNAISAVGASCEYAVVAVENNVEGVVNEVYDALFDSGLFILCQTVLPIKHSLIAQCGVKISDIKTVKSHAQAIGQCRKFLTELGVPVVASMSTSAALCEAKGNVAAIAFRPHDGQCVLKSGIQDSAHNATRFALLGKTPFATGGTVSIAFDLKNEPGALLGVLKAIYDRGVNLTRILSRPHRDGSGKYRFFADFDFEGGENGLDVLLGEVKKGCEDFRFLGRYDVDTASGI